MLLQAVLKLRLCLTVGMNCGLIGKVNMVVTVRRPGAILLACDTRLRSWRKEDWL